MTKDKLFEEELARRNPDWEKIVAVHNAALAAEQKKNDDWRNTERRVAKERDEAREQLACALEDRDAAREKVEQLAGALKILRSEFPLNDKYALLCDAALAKIGGKC